MLHKFTIRFYYKFLIFNKNAWNIYLWLVVKIYRSANIIVGESNFKKRLNNSGNMKHKTNGLTEREIDVLKFVILGYNNKTIGKKLFITNHTVKAHLTQIYKKLGVTNRTAAAIKAKDNNIIPPQDSEQP